MENFYKKTAGGCFLAPMAGIADRAYRETAERFGAGGSTSEMISAKGLVYGDKKTASLCFVPENREKLFGLQLFCAEPEIMGEAVREILKMGYRPDFFDINMGCPVPKVIGTGAGAALMKTPETAFAIAAAAKTAAGDIPVTVKIRAGFDEKNINAAEFAKGLEAAGAAAITVHGRTKVQGYSGKADLGIIKSVKESIKIPVIGNGDINSPEAAKRMFEITGVDGIMVGRGSYGRPWIFGQINEYIKTGTYPPEPDFIERIAVMTSQIRLAVLYKGEAAAMREARTQCAFYLKGFPGAARLRGKCSYLKTFEDYESLIKEI
ncbi:MAG: tRNA dihydrouridine synthase DusB [Ruminococcus sp.]|jgi:nifR3 family TIM-barrel protein|nr:tRNA dihydrouridine synthase DusB [Ruminococcus sp.]